MRRDQSLRSDLELRRKRVIQGGLFLILAMVYGWFHPGGDWNHNARHDQIRSIVEQGRLDIDDYLLYLLEPRADGSLTYRRLPLVTGSPSEADLAPRLPRLNTLDISIADGHYYPNKAPGVTLLSVPGYGLIYAIMRLLGLDPDDWWVLTLGSHFTTLLFVSLVSALGGPIFYAAVTGLFPEASERVRICAALTYGLGTLVMAYSTHLVDHGPVAALGLLSFHWARSASMPKGSEEAAPFLRSFGAGLAAGLAVLMNYSALLTVVIIGLYILYSLGAGRNLAGFVLGGGGPALVHFWYHWVCFGDPFSISQQFQVEMWQSGDSHWLGVFGAFDWSVLPEILFLPYRGLFHSSPVLLLALYGLVRVIGQRRLQVESMLICAVIVSFVLLNLSFNGWHGGAAMGPRYLIPMIPFLALTLVPAFEQLPRIGLVLASASIGMMFLITAVTPYVDIQIRDPMREFYIPLVAGERVQSGGYEYSGTISVHASGVAGGDIEVAAPTTQYARWNAFNLGEFLFPGSWLSLLPLAGAAGAIAALLLRGARRGPDAPEPGRA